MLGMDLLEGFGSKFKNYLVYTWVLSTRIVNSIFIYFCTCYSKYPSILKKLNKSLNLNYSTKNPIQSIL